MRVRTFILSCAVFALLASSWPSGEAVTCTVEPNNANCVDCSNPNNAQNAECLAETSTEITTTETPISSTRVESSTQTTSARPTRGGGGRPWRQPGWHRGHRRGGR
ncbi:hypothetical protein KR222_003852, partial [Zaprionus bogoriensis]